MLEVKVVKERDDFHGVKQGVLWGECKKQSNCFYALYHIFKLSQLIIGFFSCIPLPGTLKLNTCRCFKDLLCGFLREGNLTIY